MTFYKRKRPLSPRQQKFVEQYLICGVGRQAAIRAGYSAGNAGSAAWRLRRMPHVATAIRIGRSSEARRAQVERERVLLELLRVALSDIGEVLDWTSGEDITLRPKAEISPHHRAAIAEIAPRRMGKGARVKLHNKTQALEAIARHLGLFDKQPPLIDLQARQRDNRDARMILLERLARLKRPSDTSADSMNAGAPLYCPSLPSSCPPSPPSSFSPSPPSSFRPSPPSSFSPSPPLGGEGRVRGTSGANRDEGSPSPASTFPPGFALPPK